MNSTRIDQAPSKASRLWANGGEPETTVGIAMSILLPLTNKVWIMLCCNSNDEKLLHLG